MSKTCRYKEYCGGCQLQGMSYSKQLAFKQEKIEKLLAKFHKVNPIIGMANPFNYRNKIQVSFCYDEKHKVVCGNYIPSTHIIVPIEECMIADEYSLEIIKTIKELIIKYTISLFDEVALKGGIRHVQIRCTNTNEYMVIIVSGTNTIYKIDSLIKDLLRKHKEIKTIVQNINRKHTSMVLGDKNIVLFGKGYISDILCGLKFNLSPSSFYQVNKRQTEVLYSTALEKANISNKDIVIDAYSGIGTISLILAKKSKEVLAVELNKQATRDAIRNAKINDIHNVTFIGDDAGSFMKKLAKQRKQIDVVCMDPPRTGADDKFLQALCTLKPKKIIYISCGPESLRNNLKYLTRNNYSIEFIQPVDMFPLTSHVECVVSMRRKDNK